MKIFQILIAAVICCSAVPAVADDLELARSLMYCSNFYVIGANAPSNASRKKVFVGLAEQHFVGAEPLLNNDSPRILAEGTAAGAKVKSNLREANSRGVGGEFVSSTIAKCVELWNNNRHDLLQRRLELKPSPFFSIFRTESVTAQEIESSQNYLKALSGVQIDDADKNFVTMRFHRKTNDGEEYAYHMYTKPSSPAHPAVIFRQVITKSGEAAPKVGYMGSFAGDEKEYRAWHQMIYLFNDAFRALPVVATTAKPDQLTTPSYIIRSKDRGAPFDLVVTETKRQPEKSYLSIPGFHNRSAAGSRWLMCAYNDLAAKRGYQYWTAIYPESEDGEVVVGFSNSASADPSVILGSDYAKSRAIPDKLATVQVLAQRLCINNF